MRAIFVILLVTLVSGFAQAQHGGLDALGRLFYKGPFEVSPEGSTRAAKVYLPKSYESREKWPLILMLHGYTSNADETNLYLGLGARVSAKGYILVTPNGMKNSKGDQFWNATDFCCDFEKTNVDDVGYLLGLIKKVSAEYHVDAERIYLVGHSNGGFMSNRLLCETDGVFAGVVSIAGSTFKDASNCKMKNPVSYLQVHAEDDPTVAFGENPQHAGGKATVAQRVAAAGCTGQPVSGGRKDIVFLMPFKDAEVQSWNQCQGATEVELWTISPSSVSGHKPHAPGFWFPSFIDSAVDFLFRHTRPAGGSHN